MVDNIVHLCVWRVRWQLWHSSSSSSSSCFSLSLYLARACCPGFTNKLGRRYESYSKNILLIYLSPLADLSFLKDEDLLIFPSFCMMMVLGLMPLSTPLFWNIQFKCFSQFPLCLHQCSISGVSVMSSSNFVSIFVHKLEYLNLQQFSERRVVNDGSH